MQSLNVPVTHAIHYKENMRYFSHHFHQFLVVIPRVHISFVIMSWVVIKLNLNRLPSYVLYNYQQIQNRECGQDHGKAKRMRANAKLRTWYFQGLKGKTPFERCWIKDFCPMEDCKIPSRKFESCSIETFHSLRHEIEKDGERSNLPFTFPVDPVQCYRRGGGFHTQL